MKEYACKNEEAIYFEKIESDFRTPFFRDIDKILYSLAFSSIKLSLFILILYFCNKDTSTLSLFKIVINLFSSKSGYSSFTFDIICTIFVL